MVEKKVKKKIEKKTGMVALVTNANLMAEYLASDKINALTDSEFNNMINVVEYLNYLKNSIKNNRTRMKDVKRYTNDIMRFGIAALGGESE